MLLLVGSVSAAPQIYLDSYNTSAKMILHMNGTSGGTTFYDDTGKTVTQYGDAQTDTNIKFLGSASALLDGIGDYLTLANSPDWNTGTSNFTIISVINTTTATSEQAILSHGYNGFVYYIKSDGRVRFYAYSGGSEAIDYTTVSPVIIANTWMHLVFERQGATAKLYINGTDTPLTETKAFGTQSVDSPTRLMGVGVYDADGASGGPTIFLNGHNDEVAFYNGVAIPISEIYPTNAEIQCTIPPSATFTATPTTGFAPLLVKFNETSASSGTSWQWNATNVTGDNIPFTFNSTSGSPVYVFTYGGNYSISLKSTNAGGSNISTQAIFVNITTENELAADFASNITTGYPNDYFQFTDLTTDTPTTWNWTFGDLGTSTDQNPMHQYTSVGLYDVSLNVTNSTSFNSTTKFNYINISALPAPTAPAFTANKTYTTNPSLPVLFTITSAAPPRMTSYNMSFGDGTWSNTSSSIFGTIEHTYATIGVFSPSLYIYNTAGEAHTTNINMIILSDPFVYLVNNPTTINYGIPSNLTLQLDNVSHVDAVLVNITYNSTALEVKNIYPATGWAQQNTIGSGFVKINLTKTDASFNINTSAAYIQFNVTKSVGLNVSEPINFIPSDSGVISNTSYTQGVYTFNSTHNGSIIPTATTVTQIFYIYRTDTGELLSTVQVTNDYTGVINGTTYTTSGTFAITSLWGHINLTSSASAFYANTLYGVEINGGTTNIYMTPYVPDNTVKLNQLYPKEVRFVALDTANGAVIPGIGVTAVSYNATYDGTNWEAKLYGVSSAATSIQNTVMVGTTDAGGSITFPMISSNQYAMSFVNASAGINQSLLVFPLQTEYRVWIDTTGATNNTLSQISGSNLTVSEPNSSYVTLGMNYIDTSGLTENVTFTVTSQSNSTVIYTETITSGIAAGVSSDYTIQNIRGDGFVWKYVAYRSDSSVLSQGAGVTMKGPNGVLVDMGLPSTGWYQWISMCCLFMLASLASQRTKQYWALLIPIFAAIFLWFGWFTGKSTLAGIVILCAVLGAIIYMKSSLREKFGIGGPGTMLLNIIVYLMILQACVGFINGLEIWSDAGMTNQAVTPTNAYMNIELTTISNLQGAAGLTGDIIATATIFVDMALTALGIFGFMLFSLITIYPTIQLLFPWMLQSAQTIALFALIQIGIWIMYVLFIYQTWYKPTIGTADF